MSLNISSIVDLIAYGSLILGIFTLLAVLISLNKRSPNKHLQRAIRREQRRVGKVRNWEYDLRPGMTVVLHRFVAANGETGSVSISQDQSGYLAHCQVGDNFHENHEGQALFINGRLLAKGESQRVLTGDQLYLRRRGQVPEVVGIKLF